MTVRACQHRGCRHPRGDCRSAPVLAHLLNARIRPCHHSLFVYPGDDEAKTKELFDEVDVDHNGKISMEEYVNWVDSSPPRELKVLSDEIKNKVSPITGQRHDYEVDTIVMPVRAAYAKLECGGTCPNAEAHYTINSPQVNPPPHLPISCSLGSREDASSLEDEGERAFPVVALPLSSDSDHQRL